MKRISFVAVLALAGFFLAVFGFTGPALQAADMIQVKGSDSEVNLVQRLAEVFMQKNPGAKIAVTGGGSGTGIAALINKKTDIANSSRDMSEKEIEAAKKAGVNPIGVAFATDGISVITHPENPVKKLTLEQLGMLFGGKVKNWKEVGGADMPVSLYGRQSNSGTYVFFRELVVKGDYSPQMKSMNGNAQIVEGIQRDKAGIGYVAVGYVVDEKGTVKPGVQLVGVSKDAQSEAFLPDKLDNIMSGKYPISRPLYHFLNGKPTGKLAEFIKFELSPEGQTIVRQQGFFPVQEKWMEFNKKQGVM